VRVVIANFSPPQPGGPDAHSYWARFEPPQPPEPRVSLFDLPHDWGFHIYSIGAYLMDRGVADRVEFWDYTPERGASYLPSGILRMHFLNEADIQAYLTVTGVPDLFINYGRHGRGMLRWLDGKCFRVYVPASRAGLPDQRNRDAECYLVDDEAFLDNRSLLYIPVVNLERIRPSEAPKVRDFIYLAANYRGKRHDLLIDQVRGSALTGHLHPVDGSQLNLRRAQITTSDWDERDVAELLQTSRIAVYPGDNTSNPAAMWECVAAGLPIVINREILGGKHLVVPGVTGELANPRTFRKTMEHVLCHRDEYRPRAHFEEHWGMFTIIERYLAFFVRMGWPFPLPAGAAWYPEESKD